MTKSVKITPDGKILEVTEEEEDRSKREGFGTAEAYWCQSTGATTGSLG